MEANKLYRQLETDFITPKMSDDWAARMAPIAGYLSDNFRSRSMGLVCDFAGEVKKAYTAVFPSDFVLEKILAAGEHDALLFVHHPMVWDIRKSPEVFSNMDPELLRQFKDRKISIFNFHVPLDNYGPYSTSVSLAKALGIVVEKPFAPYFGGLCGVVGKTGLATVFGISEKLREAIGHEPKLYRYGSEETKNNRVAVVAGGGNSLDVLKEAFELGVKTFVTGISARNDFSKPAHEFAQDHKINILGGIHYSTEKFACIALVDYFKQLGLPAEFIEDRPVMEDL